MLRVGLTGNIASGKSTVSRVWARLGAHVIDADELARRAVEPGSPGLARLVEEFGPGILDDDGRLDRGAMRRLVFRDPEARRRLEAVVHPEVARLRAEAEAALAEAGVDVVVNEIPLLFEVGLESSFDIVVLVEADVATRLERLMRTRGLDRAEALRMIEAQMPSEMKRAGADYIIRNDGTVAELEAEAERVWREIVERAGSSA
ncbi:MAG TPA: dephospho-CoA kinase [Longimicrobiales bacterium]|nr:dephospho-CoA kinase [Longimicrobiales bacterium]